VNGYLISLITCGGLEKMLLKRLLLAAISLVAGVLITLFIVYVLLQTTYQEFWTDLTGIPYFILTIFFIAAGIAIWLDRYMGTNILPE
jgi:protein-S-isoprenylcysteine O-methyltransferase Ste14